MKLTNKEIQSKIDKLRDKWVKLGFKIDGTLHDDETQLDSYELINDNKDEVFIAGQLSCFWPNKLEVKVEIDPFVWNEDNHFRYEVVFECFAVSSNLYINLPIEVFEEEYPKDGSYPMNTRFSAEALDGLRETIIYTHMALDEDKPSVEKDENSGKFIGKYESYEFVVYGDNLIETYTKLETRRESYLKENGIKSDGWLISNDW